MHYIYARNYSTSLKKRLSNIYVFIISRLNEDK